MIKRLILAYQSVLASMFYITFLIKSPEVVHIINKITQNRQLYEELHKAIIRKFEKGIIHSSFMDNIWGAGIADIQLISKINEEIHFSLCVTNIFSKYSWISLKDKKSIATTIAFQKMVD